MTDMFLVQRRKSLPAVDGGRDEFWYKLATVEVEVLDEWTRTMLVEEACEQANIGFDPDAEYQVAKLESSCSFTPADVESNRTEGSSTSEAKA